MLRGHEGRASRIWPEGPEYDSPGSGEWQDATLLTRGNESFKFLESGESATDG
jgi:hypothetical protein